MIREKINELKNQIDLKVESIKIEIDNEREILFSQLNHIQVRLNKYFI